MDQENCISSAFSHLYTEQEATEFVKLSSFIVHHVDARWAIVPSAEPVRPQCTLIPYGHVCLRCFCISVQMSTVPNRLTVAAYRSDNDGI